MGVKSKMVATVDEISFLSKYFNVACDRVHRKDIHEPLQIKTAKSGTIKGLNSIAKHLAKSSNSENLLGTTREEVAAVSQWLEYQSLNVSRCEQECDVQTVLQELDAFLLDKVFFVGSAVTLADLLIFHGLHHIMSGLTFYQKQKYNNLSRWYNNIQHLPQVQQLMKEVHFSKTQLYFGHHH